jgi:hypothetical protein
VPSCQRRRNDLTPAETCGPDNQNVHAVTLLFIVKGTEREGGAQWRLLVSYRATTSRTVLPVGSAMLKPSAS